MRKTRLAPRTFLWSFTSKVFGILGLFRRELAIAILLGTVLLVTIMVLGAMDTDSGESSVHVQRVDFCVEDLDAWIDEARHLARLSDEGDFVSRGHTLPAFLEWAKTNQDRLAGGPGQLPPTRFLGITLALHQARCEFRRRAEFEVLLSEDEKSYESLEAAGVEFPFPGELPAISDEEEKCLGCYEYRFQAVEEVLAELIPGIPYVVPAWEWKEQYGETPEEAGRKAPECASPMWRVVNPSRHGPKVVRVR